MNKKIALFATAAILGLASCSQSTDIINDVDLSNTQVETPVTFGTYTSQSASTRAGVTGDITTDGTNGTTMSLGTLGFGVFAYNTKANDYGNGTSTMAQRVEGNNAAALIYTPDFMYNEKVTLGTDNKWTYSPLKYWPNGNATTAADNSGATADAVQKLSFFAYAPHVNAAQNSSDKTQNAIAYTGDSAPETATATGITHISGNAKTGDPIITYKLATTGDNVDLLWGTTWENGATLNAASGASTAQLGVKADGPNDDNIKVNENLTKMTSGANGGTIGFSFKHALAKFGGSTGKANTGNGLTIRLDPDFTDTNNSWNTTDAQTKVTVENITIVSTNTIASGDNKDKTTLGGTLNLATGAWDLTPETSASSTTTVINTSGEGGNVHGAINTDFAEPATTVDEWSDLSSIKGVPAESAANVYASEAAPILLMPGTKPSFVVTVTYIVRTEDSKLAKGYSEIKQTITKNVSFEETVAMNKRYTLNMILGLTSVKFTAEVADWESDNASVKNDANSTASANVYLPINVDGE